MPEMHEAAWTFGHRRLVFMDLTFGLTSSKVLTLIFMALKPDNTGVPITVIHFSAKEDAKATHASYNTATISRVLGKFKEGLGLNEQGETISFKVAQTDMDTREHAALQEHWPAIILLLCIFHVWQAWKNALTTKLRKIPKGDARKAVRKRLASFLAELIQNTPECIEAEAQYRAEIAHFEAMKASAMKKPRGRITKAKQDE